MEYHWYEDYWAMPRNLPKGHQFFIGYYQTQRAKRFRVENIHTDQSVFLSTWLLDNGYRVFLHTVTSKEFKTPINFIKLSDVLLRRTFSLEYIFELKEYKIGVAQACCPDLFV